jgi:hypothetical protein
MKLFNKNTLPKLLTRTESLACIPYKSPTVTYHTLDHGELRLEYPLTIQPFFVKLAERWQKGQNRPPTRKIELDALGSIVWSMLDGEKTVAFIIKEFAAISGFSLREAEISVTTFIRELGRRGLILLR